MKLKSKYSELEICEYIVKRLSDNFLKKLILENNAVRIKYGAFDKKKFKYTRDKALETVANVVKSNKILRDEIIDYWIIKAKVIYIESEKLESIEEINKLTEEYTSSKALFALAINLWIKSSDELNQHGDKVFEKCLENKYESEREHEGSKMGEKSKMLSMNLVECIDLISNHEIKIKEYEEKLKAKEEIIKELRERLKENESKEIKKEVIKLGKSIQKNGVDIKDAKTEIMKATNNLKTELASVKKETSKQSLEIEDNNKLAISEIYKMVKEMNDTISNSVNENNRKLIEEINKAIDNKVDGLRKANLTEIKEEVKESKKIEERGTNLEDFSGLDDIGLDTINLE